MMNKKYIVEVIERETKEVIKHFEFDNYRKADRVEEGGFAPIFPDICYHLTHYKPAAADIPVASDN
ncbi:hypothetical protein FCW17_23055, partial [Escherichia coli]|nr:hypothetical protein [Escherichia coli]